MTTLRVFWSMYGQDSIWMVVSMTFLVCGFAAGHSLGKHEGRSAGFTDGFQWGTRIAKQPRDSKGRYVPAKR